MTNFFGTTRPRHAQRGVRRLRQVDSLVTSKVYHMREIAMDFYMTLLTVELHSKTILQCEEEVCAHYRHVAIEDM